MCSHLSDDNRANAATSISNVNALLQTGRGRGLHHFAAMSSLGSYSAPHSNASGLATLINMVEGCKLFVLGAPRNGSSLPTPRPGKDNDSQYELFNDCEIHAVLLQAGDSL